MFLEFQGNMRRVDPKNEIFRKISKNVKYLKNVHLREMEFKPGRNKLFQGEN